MSRYKAVIISGPTASGKTDLAEYLYNVFDKCSMIINSDSMQAFESLKKLTAVPDIKKHHLLYGYKKYFEDSSLGLWFKEVKSILENQKSGVPIIVGGTGMYIKSLIYGMINVPSVSEEARSRVRRDYEKMGKRSFYDCLREKDPEFQTEYNKADKQRMLRAAEVFLCTGQSINSFSHQKLSVHDYKFLHLTLVPERRYLYDNCNKRFDGMLSSGVIEEVSALQNKVAAENQKLGLISKALGFQEISDYLDGLIDKSFMAEKTKQRTRNYAKRQLTWFRHQPEAIQISYDRMSSDLEQSVHTRVRQFIR